jgi:CheY-like chemotaxis protein
VGISTDELETIFDKFSQGANNAAGAVRRFGGLGLGLAISRKLVEMHGGSIHAASPGPESGSTFSIVLPLLAAELAPMTEDIRKLHASHLYPGVPAAKIPQSNGMTALNRPSILLVEDHLPTQAAIRKLLSRYYTRVSVAATIADALAMARERTVDLLISDIGLSDGDGYQLMRELRESQPSILGIALSGFGMDGDRERSKAAGFGQHLTKPINFDALFRAIDEMVKGREDLAAGAPSGQADSGHAVGPQ